MAGTAGVLHQWCHQETGPIMMTNFSCRSKSSKIFQIVVLNACISVLEIELSYTNLEGHTTPCDSRSNFDRNLSFITTNFIPLTIRCALYLKLTSGMLIQE